MKKSTPIIWIIGYSNSGKTLLANKLQSSLAEDYSRDIIILDGDAIRSVLKMHNSHYDLGSRKDNALRIGRLASLISSQGLPVIVAANTFFRDVQEYLRKNLDSYFEIYLRSDLSTRKARDGDKGIYQKFDRKEIKNVMGLDIAGEEPQNPDLLLDNYIDTPIEKLVKITIKMLSHKIKGFLD